MARALGVGLTLGCLMGGFKWPELLGLGALLYGIASLRQGASDVLLLETYEAWREDCDCGERRC